MLQVELVSPERTLFSGEADMVITRIEGGGDIAFMTGHAPFIGALGVGKLRIRRPGGSEEVAAVHGGFVQVSGDRVIVLSDTAELASQIDAERARRAAERIQRGETDLEEAAATAALARARTRLDVVGAG